MDYSQLHTSVWQVAAAVLIFVLTYVFILAERYNRALVALGGAALMLILGLVDIKAAATYHIVWQTLLLMGGMMIITGAVGESGFFQYMAVKTIQWKKGKPLRILLHLTLLAALGSAVLDQVTAILLIVPVTLAVCRVLKLGPVPFLVSVMAASNIGAAATLVGGQTNMMIGTAAGLDFNSFLIRLAPVALLILAVTMLFLWLVYRKKWENSPDNKKDWMSLDAESYVVNPRLAILSLSVLGLTFLGFMVLPLAQIEEGTVAAIGALVILIAGFRQIRPLKALESVEWVTLVFLAGFFILVGGLVETGVISKMAARLLEITDGGIPFTSQMVLWFSAVGAAVLENVPWTATMIPLIQEIGVQTNSASQSLNPLWWALALGVSLGGNGSLVGASSNMIAAGMAVRGGSGVTYTDFLKVGLPVTLISLMISSVYLYFVF